MSKNSERINEGASTSKSSRYGSAYKQQEHDTEEETNTDESILLSNRSTPITTTELMSVKYLEASKDSTERLRIRAILSDICHHALHDNWSQARDLMLMSHLQQTIRNTDRSTQILYNRTMAQLGLCSFRHANMKDAHDCLLDLMKNRKPRELLAQGCLPQREHDQRHTPSIMPINVELLECVYLVSAMLVDIPCLAQHDFDVKRRRISSWLFQVLRYSERQSLVGPPDSTREHVVAATKALQKGNWSSCNDLIVNEKMNAKVWDLFHQADQIKAMLTKLIKVESLRTYLFTYSHIYDSISIGTLAEMFELEKSVVHSTICKMIFNGELMALLNDPKQSIEMISKPTSLQFLALQLAEKINKFVDCNEKILNKNHGNFVLKGAKQKRQKELSKKN